MRFTRVLCRRHGRDAGYPTPPAQNPGVRNYRTGLFKHIRLRIQAKQSSIDSVKTLFEKKETLRLRLEQVMPYETCNQAKAKPFKASQR
jgi:hypothetical protein